MNGMNKHFSTIIYTKRSFILLYFISHDTGFIEKLEFTTFNNHRQGSLESFRTFSSLPSRSFLDSSTTTDCNIRIVFGQRKSGFSIKTVPFPSIMRVKHSTKGKEILFPVGMYSPYHSFPSFK